MPRVTVTLQSDECDALRIMAQQERRDPRAQAALIIRRELERVGLLPVEGGRAAAKDEGGGVKDEG